MRLIVILSFLFISNNSFSQKIYSTKYKSQADIDVFVTQFKSQADLLVYKVEYISQAKQNIGLWYFVDNESRSNKKIFFSDRKVILSAIKNKFTLFCTLAFIQHL